MFSELFSGANRPLAVFGLLATLVLLWAGVFLVSAYRRRHRAASLPKGAEAALWSITEVVPDPRNHLAIKDPTSELRLSDEERQLAAADAATLRATTERPAERAAAERARAARRAALEKYERQAHDRRPVGAA